MKQLFEFFKTTVAGGFFVVLPVVLIILVIITTVGEVKGILAPIAAMLPLDIFASESLRNVIALLIILAICFAAGILVRTTLGGKFWSWVNQTLLDKIPGYTLFRTFSRQLANTEDTSQFQPAVIQLQDETRVLVFIVEEHANGDCTVLFPTAPTPLMGEVHYVPARLVKKLDVPMSEAISCITQWGLGSAKLFNPQGIEQKK